MYLKQLTKRMPRKDQSDLNGCDGRKSLSALLSSRKQSFDTQVDSTGRHLRIGGMFKQQRGFRDEMNTLNIKVSSLRKNKLEADCHFPMMT